MGCGQSKINLYPRRNKNGGRGNNAKKSGAADKEADEEEGPAGGAEGAEGAGADADDDTDTGKHILPLTHPHTIEVSESQQDFFKMLDEKIEKGRDYDSSSETEMRVEQERRKLLIHQWRSASQSTQSTLSQPSPPTPVRRRVPRPGPPPPERQTSPGSVRRYCRQQHASDGMSPPPRRAQSAQSHHHDPRVNGDSWHNDPTKSPIKRPQSAGASWKNNPKVAPYNQKPKKNDVNENHKSNQREDVTDVSQITFNPTFQTHSPAHSAKTQPYVAQIVAYPSTQQVTPPQTPKFIAPPEEYQDPQNNIVDNKYETTQPQKHTPAPQAQSPSQNIYYIHGNSSTTIAQDVVQQRQQTAIHLQQYVAMKQAQQQMFTILQRGPHTVFPNVDYSARNPNRIYENEDFCQYVHAGLRPHSAPSPVGVAKPIPVPPVYGPVPDGGHVVPVPMWPSMPPLNPWVPGQVPPEMQYYPQSQFMPMYRPQSAGSAGTLTRYRKESEGEVKSSVCQSINLVRQKPIGQIVNIPGQDLTVCNNVGDSPSPASISTDSGVSPGNSVPSTKNFLGTPLAGFNDFSHVDNTSKTKKSKNPINNTRSLKNSKSLDS